MTDTGRQICREKRWRKEIGFVEEAKKVGKREKMKRERE